MEYTALNESLNGKAEALIRELKPSLNIPVANWWKALPGPEKTRWSGILHAKLKPAAKGKKEKEGGSEGKDESPAV